MKAPIIQAMAYPKKMMGLPLELWALVIMTGLVTGFFIGLATGAQLTMTVGAGVIGAGCCFAFGYLQIQRDPFFLLRVLEYGQTAPFQNKARFSGDVKGKRYVP
ncbi:MAG TPA: hypothetical protein DD390_12135 [Rhodospirillaceae bacterium]|jgi:hypothetical protein|nr:hypothetical protein [Rhodospirillaceae bacterium]MAX61944.1 hypothetical protein [Rhodospirillaceae bacterium]MAX63280.1 hypothetical protein [Rhodospirillaceae bacterium]HBM13436.1 hypothetical protein [Rhodospirillaceae bacterium]|tara:strand:- start:575 stop:886 length:312 start_codon:yes stop_codon:yes gene_type:complete